MRRSEVKGRNRWTLVDHIGMELQTRTWKKSVGGKLKWPFQKKKSKTSMEGGKFLFK